MVAPEDRPDDDSHLPGATTGSSERAPQQLTSPILVFDLQAEAAQVRYEQGYREGERNANTLVKGPRLRIVLTALRRGARLQEHQAPGPVTIHTLSGHLRCHAGGQTLDLPAGHLASLEGSIPHDVEALEDS